MDAQRCISGNTICPAAEIRGLLSKASGLSGCFCYGFQVVTEKDREELLSTPQEEGCFATSLLESEERELLPR